MYDSVTIPTMLFSQTAPVQEECNGPMPSPKPQEPSTNHTGSGNMTFPLHIKTSPPIKCRFLSPLTCVAVSRPQTSASCHLSGGPSRDSSPPRLCQARVKFRYAAKIDLAYPSLWPQKLKSLICCRVHSDSSGGGLFSNTAARAYLANAMGGEWPDAYMKELTCCAVGDDIKPPAVILSSSV